MGFRCKSLRFHTFGPSSGTLNEKIMIATIGEALVDLIEQADGRFQACLGGSVCNFTIGLARQGVSTTYLNPLSTDHFGARFAALLQGSEVKLASGRPSPCPTALSVVNIDAAGSPTYAFHRQGVADRDISAMDLVARLPVDCELLHTGGLALVPEDLEKILLAMQAVTGLGALVSIDANLRPQVVSEPVDYIDGVRRALRLAHIAKVSDDDLAHMGLGGAGLDEISRVLFDDSALQLIAVTKGSQGAALLTRSCRVELPAPGNLPVVDTVGAGDCFHAGLIAYLQRSGMLVSISALQGLQLEYMHAALQHAISAASVNIMRAGCDPATWAQTVQFQKNPGSIFH